MAFTFNSNPAKEAFGRIKQIQYASDYITNKKAKIVFCKGITIDKNVGLIYPCDRMSRVASYETRMLFNRGKIMKNIQLRRLPFFNYNNLEVNLFTKENLNCVDVMQETTSPSPVPYPPVQATAPFYWNTRIDPKGELFGNSQCGVNNFVDTLQYNPIEYYMKAGVLYARPSVKNTIPTFIPQNKANCGL